MPIPNLLCYEHQDAPVRGASSVALAVGSFWYRSPFDNLLGEIAVHLQLYRHFCASA
ncbi:hypothetical protein SAMN05518669_12962 [Variovorax sp. YR634]|nr:hypothetical protein SAMN05518669_12962 [Variovorax sp. YR634]